MNISVVVRRAQALAFTCAALWAGGAAAQMPQWPSYSPGPWHYAATLYLYLPSVNGEMAFPTRGGDGSVSVHPENVLKTLNFAFMGNLDAHNGQWGVFTDLLYLDISGSHNGSRDFEIGGGRVSIPASVNGNFDLTIKGSAWTLAGEYRLASDRDFTSDVLLGVRLLDIKPRLDWSLSGDLSSIPTQGRGGNIEISGRNWDGIIGVKGAYNFGQRYEWFVPYYADVGTGNSELTWQFAAGIGYRFAWGDITGMWRYLYYRFKNEDAIDNINFNGPMFGVTWRW
jgi:hypothetical protein